MLDFWFNEVEILSDFRFLDIECKKNLDQRFFAFIKCPIDGSLQLFVAFGTIFGQLLSIVLLDVYENEVDFLTKPLAKLLYVDVVVGLQRLCLVHEPLNNGRYSAREVIDLRRKLSIFSLCQGNLLVSVVDYPLPTLPNCFIPKIEFRRDCDGGDCAIEKSCRKMREINQYQIKPTCGI